MNKTTYRFVQSLVALYLLTALALSFTHVADLFGLLGSNWQRWIAPVMIDVAAIIGKLSMSTAFTPSTRTRGKIALWVAGSISFTANVAVGIAHDRLGDALLGALVVFGALWAESHLTRLRPTTTRPAKAAAPAKAATRKAPATRKPATTRKPAAPKPTPVVAMAADTRGYL